jgi:hypothetical protein
MARPAHPKEPERPKVLIRFTGAAGGSCYVVDGKVLLRPGISISAPLEGHWAALVASGDAEVVEE